MKYKIIDLIDFEKVNDLLEGFNKTTGFVTAILDLDGKVLSKSGWRQMCTEFHRINPETAKKCTISDTVLADKMAVGEKYHFYKCLNGLVDVAIPIIIKDEHIANLFTGQFFFEKPDYAFFIKQAKKYGFNEKTYLDALEKVPVVTEEEVKTAMDFLLDMTELIVQTTLQQVEQNELNDALKESEKRLSFHDKNSPLANIEWDADLKIRRWSNAADKIFGWTEDEMIGKSIYTLNLVDAYDFPEIQKVVEQLSSGAFNQIFLSNRNCTKNGKIIYCEWYSSVLLDQKGKLISVMSRVLNVTDRLNAEISLSESEEKYRLLHEAAGMGIGYYSTEGVVISFNKIAAQNMNGKPEDFAGKSVFDLFPKSTAEFIFDRIKKAVSSDKPLEYEDQIQLPKADKWFNSIYNRIIDSNHKVAGIQIISADITERKQTEKELIESKSFFEQLFLQSATSTQLLDPQGWCIKINPKLSELFGVLPEHIEGRKYNIFQDDEIIRTGVVNKLKKVFEQLETVKWEVNFDIQHASKSTGVKVSRPEKRWLHNTSHPILNAQGELMYVIIQHEDITTRKSAENEVIELNKKLENRVDERTKELTNSQVALLNLLEDLNEKSDQLQQSSEKLEAKNKELETFTYSVSHDLKAPLRGIDGYSRLLEELYSDKLSDEGSRFIKSIREGTKQMNQLIEDLLAYSRLERSIIRNSKFKINDLLENVFTILKNEISNNHINIEMNLENLEIETDFDGLSIIMRNLVENAIKFSGKQKNPQIKILLKENVYSWLLQVEDNGIGFDMKYHNRIFEIFQRLNLPEQYEGTGIGLAMVSKSVQRLNGKIWAESSPGNGAKFYLEIPKNYKS